MSAQPRQAAAHTGVVPWLPNAGCRCAIAGPSSMAMMAMSRSSAGAMTAASARTLLLQWSTMLMWFPAWPSASKQKQCASRLLNEQWT
ncbi:hypothetical protein HaLaN_00552 [Haematococcus lacustris]|uniref:Uncharacterized protein n=1 Tax=Haematococcus lacustris TaxID=44745 RepID=A0A699Y742_HAELA|nr:hypothetical protein HaLaN_00552 [Haematococcus lacustris]